MNDCSKQARAWKNVDGEDTDHPAGEITLSPRRVIGARMAALGGLAIGAIAAVTPLAGGGTPTTSSIG
jgi:hypothetical protein